MEKKRTLKSFMKAEYLLPLLHFLASFVYEWIPLWFQPRQEIVTAVAKNDSYSDAFERVMAYGLSKLFAALFIWCLWKLIFKVIREFKKNQTVRLFTFLTLAGLLVRVFLWPNGFIHSYDNYVTYSYAIHLYPEYWHSAYTSVVYCACLMVLPHPISISLFQALLFAFDVAYLYARMEANPKVRKAAKWFVFAIIFVPGTYYMIMDAYRTEIYALACMFYLTKILFDIWEGKEYTRLTLAIMAFFSAFLAVWRTEGILLGGMGFFAILIFAKKLQIKKLIVWLAVFAVAFLLVSFPQKIGNKKYYGSDYSIINSFFVLRNVLNSGSANLSYQGADEDLAAIEAVVPIEAIQAYGLEGYRRHNFMNGHVTDMNQSVTDMETGKAYVKAFYSIALHNPGIYLRTQLGLLRVVICLTDQPYIEYANVELSKEYPNWEFRAWQVGEQELFTAPLVLKWYEWHPRKAIAVRVENLGNRLAELRKKTYLSFAILSAIPLLCCCIFVQGVIRFFKRAKGQKTLQDLLFAYLSMMLLGQFAIITLVMPERALCYFCAVYACSFLLILVYLGKCFQQRKDKKAKQLEEA
ncbi:MAG: hypothetical protein J5546_01040 [Lachnospiraceae bacterium]|nr:hypothetical protein [Lachnospiraceae bacterium]